MFVPTGHQLKPIYPAPPKRGAAWLGQAISDVGKFIFDPSQCKHDRDYKAESCALQLGGLLPVGKVGKAGTEGAPLLAKVFGAGRGVAAAKTSTEIVPYVRYPADDGFLGGYSRVEQLKSGTLIDRFGPGGGKFAAPTGTPLSARALPPSTNTSLYSKFEVVGPLEVKAGLAAPFYGQSGLGIQYRLPASVDDLVDQGVLRRLP